jgi:hypothetical protein
VSSHIYIEGGGEDSKQLAILCREGFRKLLEKCGFGTQRRMPRLFACGSRSATFEAFKVALKSHSENDFLAMWIDSEEPLNDLEAAWAHLSARDQWVQPEGSFDKQVLFMTTCMETLCVADRKALQEHFKAGLQNSALPSLHNLESRNRHDIQEGLKHATRNCSNAYEKGKRSFEILGKLNPATLDQYLPSFTRTRRILDERL